jgi:predicted DNA-binding transcriptional regulator AlpA
MLAVMDEVMGAAEIAELLGVSRQRVQQLVVRPDFPKPVARLTMGKVWNTEAVQAWNAERLRRLTGE